MKLVTVQVNAVQFSVILSLGVGCRGGAGATLRVLVTRP